MKRESKLLIITSQAHQTYRPQTGPVRTAEQARAKRTDQEGREPLLGLRWRVIRRDFGFSVRSTLLFRGGGRRTETRKGLWGKCPAHAERFRQRLTQQEWPAFHGL